MHFQNDDNTMPEVIYEGYKFPQSYAICGEIDIHELDENNSSAFVYTGNRMDILNLMNEIFSKLQDDDTSDDDFSVIALWDNYVEKNNTDYIMLAAIVSHREYNPLDFMNISTSVYQLTDNSTIDTDA